MTAPDGVDDTMREPADWMRGADDRILELIRDHGNLNPSGFEALGGPSGPSRDYAGRRAKLLVEAGLLYQVYPDGALYGLTFLGEGYLEEEVSGDDLPTPQSLKEDDEDAGDSE